MVKTIDYFFAATILATANITWNYESTRNATSHSAKPVVIPSYTVIDVTSLRISETEYVKYCECINKNQLLCIAGQTVARIQVWIDTDGMVHSEIKEYYSLPIYSATVDGMNEYGATIGNEFISGWNDKWAFFGFQGNYTIISYLATDINNQNDITLSAWNPYGNTLHFTRGELINPVSGKVIEFPPFGGIPFYESFTQSSAESVNNQGWVVGWADTGPIAQPGEVVQKAVIGAAHAFLWKDLNGNEKNDAGEMLDIGAFFGENIRSEAIQINDRDVVVGYYYQQGTYGPRKNKFLFHDINDNYIVDNGEIALLPELNKDPFLTINGMNNLGEIYGWIGCAGPGSDALNIFSAFLWKDGNLYDLNDCIPQNLGIHLDEAVESNDQGWILCNRLLGSYASSILLIPNQSPVPSWEQMK